MERAGRVMLRTEAGGMGGQAIYCGNGSEYSGEVVIHSDRCQWVVQVCFRIDSMTAPPDEKETASECDDHSNTRFRNELDVDFLRKEVALI